MDICTCLLGWSSILHPLWNKSQERRKNPVLYKLTRQKYKKNMCPRELIAGQKCFLLIWLRYTNSTVGRRGQEISAFSLKPPQLFVAVCTTCHFSCYGSERVNYHYHMIWTQHTKKKKRKGAHPIIFSKTIKSLLLVLEIELTGNLGLHSRPYSCKNIRSTLWLGSHAYQAEVEKTIFFNIAGLS